MIEWTLLVLVYPTMELDRAPSRVEIHGGMTIESCRQMKQSLTGIFERHKQGVRINCIPSDAVEVAA